jgi:hypothetical protein
VVANARRGGAVSLGGVDLQRAPGRALVHSTPEVPRAVPVASGLLRVVLCPALLVLGIVDLMDRARVRR